MDLEVSFVRHGNVMSLSLLNSPLQLTDSQGIEVNFQILLEYIEEQGAPTNELFLHF